LPLDMFIKIGDLKGESRDKVHVGEIDVLAWSWGVSNSSLAQAGGGTGDGKCNVQDLSLTKYVDKASPSLLLACRKGAHFPTATLVVRKAGGKPLEYLKLTLTQVTVTAVSTGGSGGEDRLTENVTLNFAKVRVDYVEQKPDGGEGDKPTMTFSIAEHVNG